MTSCTCDRPVQPRPQMKAPQPSSPRLTVCRDAKCCVSCRAGNTTQFSSAFPSVGGDGTAAMEEGATEATGLEGFDLFAAARGGGDVTRGVPSLADVAAADEVRRLVDGVLGLADIRVPTWRARMRTLAQTCCVANRASCTNAWLCIGCGSASGSHHGVLRRVGVSASKKRMTRPTVGGSCVSSSGVVRCSLKVWHPM